MRYVDEFRDPGLIRQAVAGIDRLADPARHYRIMEVCGGHTHAFYRFALEELLPRNIELIHGPGCPVCVLPMGRIDDALALTTDPDVTLTTFGDVMRVPGRNGTALAHKARGADIRIVYSPLDALRIAEREPGRQVVFFAIGFETTAPSTALTLQYAKERRVGNFFVFSNHITIVPAIRAILEAPGMCLDAFIGPGHVSTVIGGYPYRFVADNYGKPVVVAGFEPLDLLQSIVMILEQLRDGTASVQLQYRRAVPWDGNRAALAAMAEVFELRPHFEWRGLGSLSQSALSIREEYAAWDAERRFSMAGVTVSDPLGAQCGDVLKGALKPQQCRLFGSACTPEQPVGALMVSSEGACAAYYHHSRRQLS